MKQLCIVALALVAAMAVACGGGDKKPAASPTERPAATRDASSADPTEAADPTERTSSGPSTDGIGGLFGSVFSSGLSGGLSGGSVSGLGAGDESLKQFLPTDSDLPAGFTPMGAFTFSVPAGTSEFGAMDMAMAMSVLGAPTSSGASRAPDLSSMQMLMAMVIRPEEMQDLGEAFDGIEDLDPQDIQDEIDSSLQGMQGLEVTRFEVLDGSGLGDGGFGMEMTIDMSGFAEAFGGPGGGTGAPGLGLMTMRMYLFGEGDYMGAVMRMGFADSLDGASEDLDIAGIIADKLERA